MLFYLRTTNETIPTNVIKMRKSRKFLSFTLRHWIPDPGVPDSKPLGGSKVRSAYHFRGRKYEYQELLGTEWKKVSLRSGSVALRLLNPIERGRKKAIKIFFKKKKLLQSTLKIKQSLKFVEYAFLVNSP